MTDSDSSVVEIDRSGRRMARPRRFLQRSTTRNNGASSVSASEPVDLDSLHFLSSSEVVREVTLQFDNVKKRMVESIGFGGMLELPNLKSHDKGFSLWLLRNLKWFTATLSIGENITLTMSAESVGKIVGLNHSGCDVAEKSFESVAEKSSFLNTRLSFLHTDTNIVQAAQSFVMDPLPNQMSQTYIDNFKVAFVIFVMGRFLAPGEVFEEGNSDFWGALEDAESIRSYNWSLYVLSNIRESARKVDWDLVRKKKLPGIGCCTVILQIFYLDNVDFGSYNLPHTVFPRVKHYSDKLIRFMIDCDMIKKNNPSNTPCYGRLQLVRYTDTCYRTSIESDVIDAGTPIPALQQLYIPRSGKESMNTNPELTPSATPPCLEAQFTPFQTGVPSFDAKSIGLSSLIHENVQSQFRGGVLEAIRSHQERCSVHMQSFSDGLKAAIAKENTNFAIRLIDHLTRINDTSRTPNTPSPLGPRHISYTSTPEAMEYASADSRHLKIQRLDKSPLMDDSKSPCQTTSLMSEFGQSSSSHYVKSKLKPCTRPNKNIPLARCASPSVPCVEAVPHLPAFTSSPQSTKAAEIAECNYRFRTPHASSQFFAREQSFSPTTENKIFNGLSLSARQINSMQSIDLNSKSFAHEYSSSPIVKKKLQPGCLANSHWSLALEAPRLRDPVSCKNFFNWLATTIQIEDLRRFWIMHAAPRFLQIEGYQLRSEFVCDSPMTFAVFDIIICRLTQIDICIYRSTAPLRWRHLFESDFSMHALADDHPIENIAVRDQFTGPSVDYDLCCCRMLFVPVLSNDTWWTYAFDMKYKTVLIMDPSNTNESDNTLFKRHHGTIQMIKDNLSSSISTLFEGWNPNFNQFHPKVFWSPCLPCTRSQSGFLTLFFISNFDGTSMTYDPSQVNIQKFKEQILFEILDMKGNAGSLPSSFVHLVD